MDKDTIKNVVSGVLVVDKPVGLTSHDVVQSSGAVLGSGVRVIPTLDLELRECW
jgi:hypothetical protein